MLWRHISTECDTDQAILYTVYDKMRTCANYILLFAAGQIQVEQVFILCHKYNLL
jgi:hypothetical protein